MRKWNRKTQLGGQGQWDFEVGEQVQPLNLDSAGMMESSSNVSIRKKTCNLKAFISNWVVASRCVILHIFKWKIKRIISGKNSKRNAHLHW